MQSIYTAGRSNYSVANMYKSAGVINISSSYLPQNSSSHVKNASGQQVNWNGDILTGPTITTTSAVAGIVSKFHNSFSETQNNNYVFGPTNTGLSIPTAPTLLGLSVVGDPTLVVNFVANNQATISLTDKNGNSVLDINGLVVQPIVSSTSPVTFIDLVDNSTYVVHITSGDFDTQREITIEAEVPKPPNLSLVSTDNSIVASFQTNVLFGYTLTLTDANTNNTITTKATTSPVTFENLTQSIYYVLITATNSVGTSDAGKSSYITLKTGIPNQPDENYIKIVDGIYTYQFNDPNVLFYQLTMINKVTNNIFKNVRLVYDPITSFYTYNLQKQTNYVFSLIAVNNDGSSSPTVTM